MDPVAPPNIKCHRSSFKKNCADLCQNCWLWVSLPTKEGSEWMCADLAMVKLQYTTIEETNGTGRAIESFRNEMVKINETPIMKRLT